MCYVFLNYHFGTDLKFFKSLYLRFYVLNMVGRAEWTQALEPQKSPNARGPKAQGHWVTSEVPHLAFRD